MEIVLRNCIDSQLNLDNLSLSLFFFSLPDPSCRYLINATSTRDRIRPSDFHISDCRLTYGNYTVVIWELSIYILVPPPPLCRPSPALFRNIDPTNRPNCRTSRLKNEVATSTKFIARQRKGYKKGERDRGNAGRRYTLAITALGRPRPNHFARPTMLSVRKP